MKKIFSYIASFAAITALFLSVVSCDLTLNIEEPHQPGEPDVAGCYGVFFPTQTTIGKNIFDPADPTQLIVKAKRTKSEGSITVPLSCSDSESIFSVGALSFEDGQDEADIEITFPEAKVGVTYTLSVSIDDPLYASSYASGATKFDLTVLREKWNSLGVGTWYENGYFSFKEPVPVEILQNDNDKNLYRCVMRWTDENGKEDAMYTMDNDPNFEFKVITPGMSLFDVKITTPGLVYFSIFDTGYENSNYGANILFVHPSHFTSLAEESNFLHNKVLQWQDAAETLPAGVQIAPYYYMSGIGGWNYTQDDNVITIIFPGAVLTDYSIDIEPGFTEEGEMPVTFTTGADVATIKYAIYEGALSSGQANLKAAAIADGSEESVKSLDIAEGNTINVKLESTGSYTIVAVSYDKEGNAQKSNYAELCYVAAGDNVPVVFSAGLESTKKYEGMGYHSDNTLEFFMYGKDITDIKFGLYTLNEYEVDPKTCIEEVSEQEMYDETDEDSVAEYMEMLKNINGAGYADIFTDLIPGTEYVFLVIASNGYERKLSEAVCKTTGKLEIKVEDMLGVYSVKGTSYFDGELEEPDLWAIEASDDEESGNIMLTAFANKECQYPIYGNVDTENNTIVIPDGKPFIVNAEKDVAYLFSTSDEDVDDVIFPILDKGKFSNKNWFGIYVTNAAISTPKGWAELYKKISASRIFEGTFAEYLEQKAASNSVASAVNKTIHNTERKINARNIYRKTLDIEREQNSVSFESTVIGSSEKKEKEFDNSFSAIF